jgi:hypothetical protein
MSPRIYIALSPNGVERVTVGAATSPMAKDEAMELYRRLIVPILDLDRAARNSPDTKNANGTWIPRTAFL